MCHDHQPSTVGCNLQLLVVVQQPKKAATFNTSQTMNCAIRREQRYVKPTAIRAQQLLNKKMYTSRTKNNIIL